MAKVKIESGAVFERYENKYLLDQHQYQRLQECLDGRMERDGYGLHTICTVYYDTDDYAIIRRCLEKPKFKEKLRLRSYGVPNEETQVFPEIKKKARGIVYKRRVSMPYGDALRYLSRRQPGGDGQIFQEFNWLLASYGSLAPRIFLSYERDSWKGRGDASLRLTLDREILWRSEALDLRRGAWGEALLEPGQVLMEVKIANAAPLWLAEALSENRIFPISFSKCGRAFETLCKNKLDETEMRRYA